VDQWRIQDFFKEGVPVGIFQLVSFSIPLFLEIKIIHHLFQLLQVEPKWQIKSALKKKMLLIYKRSKKNSVT